MRLAFLGTAGAFWDCWLLIQRATFFMRLAFLSTTGAFWDCCFLIQRTAFFVRLAFLGATGALLLFLVVIVFVVGGILRRSVWVDIVRAGLGMVAVFTLALLTDFDFRSFCLIRIA